MAKVVKLTESDLIRLVNKVMNEQNMAVGFSQPQKSNPQQKTTVGLTQQNPSDWYKDFPCLKQGGNLRMQGGTWMMGNVILLPESGAKDEAWNGMVYSANKDKVGKVKNGGVYFCDAKQPAGLVVLSR